MNNIDFINELMEDEDISSLFLDEDEVDDEYEGDPRDFEG